MGYKVVLRKNATGEERVYDCSDLPNWDDDQMYWWTDGNFGCDCNRAAAFHRAGPGEPEPTDEDWERFGCGDDAYTAVKAILPDSTEIQIDTDEAVAK